MSGDVPTCVLSSDWPIAFVQTVQMDPKVVIHIVPDGRLMRGDREVKDLPRDELLKIIDEMVLLLRQR